MAQISFKERLIEKGIKEEDVSQVARDMSSYHSHIASFNQAEEKMYDCENCPLHEENHLFGLGSLRPKVVVISDYPSERELDTQTGLDEYAMYLMIHLYRLNLTMDDIYWTYAVKAPTDNMKMLFIKECHVHLVNQLAVLNPDVIISLGTTSISSFAGQPLRIDKAVGNDYVFSIGKRDVPIIAVEHPKTFMEMDADAFKDRTRKMWQSLKKIREYI